MQIPSIDLHTCELIPDALEKLETELFLLFQKGERRIEVVHGIGEGKMAAAVHRELNRNPMVGSRLESDHGGSCIISL
ncbi:MAG: Smr/MutS family protein [Candidatus Magasanikbacteria bacterium]